MTKLWQFYDAAGALRTTKEAYLYDAAGDRRKISGGYFYDSLGERRQFFQLDSAVVFSFTRAFVVDNNEGVTYGDGAVGSMPSFSYTDANETVPLIVPLPLRPDARLGAIIDGAGGGDVPAVVRTNEIMIEFHVTGVASPLTRDDLGTIRLESDTGFVRHLPGNAAQFTWEPSGGGAFGYGRWRWDRAQAGLTIGSGNIWTVTILPEQYIINGSAFSFTSSLLEQDDFDGGAIFAGYGCWGQQAFDTGLALAGNISTPPYPELPGNTNVKLRKCLTDAATGTNAIITIEYSATRAGAPLTWLDLGATRYGLRASQSSEVNVFRYANQPAFQQGLGYAIRFLNSPE